MSLAHREVQGRRVVVLTGDQPGDTGERRLDAREIAVAARAEHLPHVVARADLTVRKLLPMGPQEISRFDHGTPPRFSPLYDGPRLARQARAASINRRAASHIRR